MDTFERKPGLRPMRTWGDLRAKAYREGLQAALDGRQSNEANVLLPYSGAYALGYMRGINPRPYNQEK